MHPMFVVVAAVIIIFVLVGIFIWVGVEPDN